MLSRRHIGPGLLSWEDTLGDIPPIAAIPTILVNVRRKRFLEYFDLCKDSIQPIIG